MGLGRFPRFGAAIYRTPQWQAARLMAKRRDGWACVKCGTKGRIEVDHIRPLRAGGDPFALSNLQCLCPACHARKTRAEVGLPDLSPARQAWRDLLQDMQHTNKQRGQSCLIP